MVSNACTCYGCVSVRRVEAARARRLAVRDCWVIRDYLAHGVSLDELDVRIFEVADVFADANSLHREAMPD